MDYFVHLLYGNGKGKTTGAMGMAVRYLGSGGKVRLVQFLKDGSSNEIDIFLTLSNLEFLCVNKPLGFTWLMNENEKSIAANLYKDLFDSAFENLPHGSMLILDEVVDLVRAGLMDENYLLERIKRYKGYAEIVITGHTVSQSVKDICDYISKIENENHPYNDGVIARKGIEF